MRYLTIIALSVAIGMWLRAMHIALVGREPARTIHLAPRVYAVFCAVMALLTLAALVGADL